jgi:hypothetical protein
MGGDAKREEGECSKGVKIFWLGKEYNISIFIFGVYFFNIGWH